MLRTEAGAGAIEDVAHMRTSYCLADSLTKSNANKAALITPVETVITTAIDSKPTLQ